MPYQVALEEKFKTKDRLLVVWPWRIFIFSLIAFILSAAVFLVMAFSFKPYLNYRIKDWNDKISSLNQSIDESQQKQLGVVYSQFVNIKNLADNHKAVSKIFDLIERNTYPTVSYSGLSVSVGEREARFEGAAPDYETLIKELKLFSQSPEIERVFLENSNLTDLGKGIKELKFKIRLILNPQLLKL